MPKMARLVFTTGAQVIGRQCSRFGALCNVGKCSLKCADNGHYALRASDDNMDQKWKFERLEFADVL